MGLFNKKELKKIEELEKEKEKYLSMLDEIGAKELLEIQNDIELLKQEKTEIENEIDNKKHIISTIEDTINNLKSTISMKKRELNQLDNDIDMMDFGFYTPKYNCMTSEEYS